MIVLKLRQEVNNAIKALHAENKQVGFVATMGALHEGHLSLIDIAAKENDCVVCSIFVNPLQFNDKADFEKYPNTLEADLKLLEAKKCAIVFVPDVQEMYGNEDSTQFDFGNLDKVMEGVYRPGHFLGMAKVVKRLFDTVKPDVAYFGEKDFQQLAIIRKFTHDLKLPVKVVGCPIMRETDGLAMSSRNVLLSSEERIVSPIIYKTLLGAKERVGKISITALKTWVETEINAVPHFKLEYFEVAEAKNLTLLNEWKSLAPIMGFIVVRVNNIRLIDNIVLVP